MGGVKESARVPEYIHEPLDEVVVAIGGSYRLVEEKRLPFQGGEVFYLIGYAHMDTSCCTIGGCSYALVMGFIRDWKYRKNSDGLDVSSIVSVEDHTARDLIRRAILSEDVVQQVIFSHEY